MLLHFLFCLRLRAEENYTDTNCLGKLPFGQHFGLGNDCSVSCVGTQVRYGVRRRIRSQLWQTLTLWHLQGFWDSFVIAVTIIIIPSQGFEWRLYERKGLVKCFGFYFFSFLSSTSMFRWSVSFLTEWMKVSQTNRFSTVCKPNKESFGAGAAFMLETSSPSRRGTLKKWGRKWRKEIGIRKTEKQGGSNFTSTVVIQGERGKHCGNCSSEVDSLPLILSFFQLSSQGLRWYLEWLFN